MLTVIWNIPRVVSEIEWIQEFTWAGWMKVELCEPESRNQGVVSLPEFSPLYIIGLRGEKWFLWGICGTEYGNHGNTQLSSAEVRQNWLTDTSSAPSIHIAFSLRPHYLQALTCQVLNLLGLLNQAHSGNTWHTSSGWFWLKNASLAWPNFCWNYTSIWNACCWILLFLLVFRESIYYPLRYPPLLLLPSSLSSKFIPSSTSFAHLIPS